MSAFLILGHGTENLINFEQRSKIPPGITLVTLAKCGLVTYQRQICPAIKAFSQKEFEPYLLDPKTHRKQLNSFMKDTLHVYTEGEYYPSLEVQLLSDFSNPNADKNGWGSSIRLFKSGVYQFPTKPEDFDIYNGEAPGPQTLFCNRGYATAELGWAGNLDSRFKLEPVYRGSIFPTPEQAQKIRDDTGGEITTMKKQLTYSLETIFEKGGPGVYFYLVCRNPKNIKDVYTYLGTNLDLNTSNFEEFHTHNWISGHEKFVPKLKNLLQKLPQTSYKSQYLQNKIPNYEKLSIVPKIRRNSIVQQKYKEDVIGSTTATDNSATGAGAGTGSANTTKGGAKTRRTKKKLRKTKRRL